MMGLRNRSSDRPLQRSPYLLWEINIFFPKIDISCYCHEGRNLLSALSLFPDEEYGNWFKIKGERAVLPPDAEESVLLRQGTPDVQILWKKIS
jgi:hypothetical protein